MVLLAVLLALVVLGALYANRQRLPGLFTPTAPRAPENPTDDGAGDDAGTAVTADGDVPVTERLPDPFNGFDPDQIYGPRPDTVQ